MSLRCAVLGSLPALTAASGSPCWGPCIRRLRAPRACGPEGSSRGWCRVIPPSAHSGLHRLGLEDRSSNLLSPSPLRPRRASRPGLAVQGQFKWPRWCPAPGAGEKGSLVCVNSFGEVEVRSFFQPNWPGDVVLRGIEPSESVWGPSNPLPPHPFYCGDSGL